MTGFFSLWTFTILSFSTLFLWLNLWIPGIWSKSCIHHLYTSSCFFALWWIEISINNIRLFFLVLRLLFFIQFLNLSHFASFCSIWCICYKICFCLNLTHCFDESHLLTVLCFSNLFRWSSVPFFQLLFFDVNFFLS